MLLAEALMYIADTMTYLAVDVLTVETFHFTLVK